MKWDYKDNKWPQGPGGLTPEGLRQSYLLGKYLQEKYIIQEPFLSKDYNPNELLIYSSNISRTILSAKALSLGLYTTNSLIFSKNQPFLENSTNTKDNKIPGFNDLIPINLNFEVNKILLPRENCLQYSNDFHNRMKNVGLITSHSKHEKIIEELSESLEIPFKEAKEIVLFAIDSAISNNFHNLSLPPKINENWIDKGFELFEESHNFLLFSSDYLARYSGSGFLNHLIQLFDSKIAKNLSQKGFVFSAHDTTIMSIFAALKIKATHPPYASMVIFELHEVNEQYYVKLIYNNMQGKETENERFKELVFYEKFRSYVKNRTFDNMEEACLNIEKIRFSSILNVYSENQNFEWFFYAKIGLSVFFIIGIYFFIKKYTKSF